MTMSLTERYDERSNQGSGLFRKLSIKKRALAITIVASMFFSCNNNIVFSEFQPVQNKKWDKQTEFVFQFEMKDVSIPYNISLQLRNSRLYPYRNLGIILEESDFSGISILDTIECMLTDSLGKWTGNGITLFQNQFLLKENYHFPDTGAYTMSIRHAMLDDRLTGIEDIGLLIEKAR